MVKAEWASSTVEKARDFIGRIDFLLCIPPIDFSINDGDPAQEYQLLACILVRKYFPQVVRVEKSVAWVLILELLNSGSPRRAGSVVFRSTDPTELAFTFACLPSDIRDMFKNDEVVQAVSGSFFRFQN